MTQGGNHEDGLQDKKTTDHSQDGQGQDGKNTEVDYEKQYKELQGEFDKRNEASYQKDLKLAENNKKYILDVDKKIQNKLIKDIYGYDNLEELKELQGDKFYEEKKSEEDDELDRTAQLEQELKLIKHKMTKGATEDAVSAYIAKHEDVFKEDGAIEKLKEELTFMSNNLSPSERVQRAGKLAFGVYVDKTSEAYRALQEVGTAGGAGKRAGEESTEDNQNIIDGIFNKKFGAKKEEK